MEKLDLLFYTYLRSRWFKIWKTSSLSRFFQQNIWNSSSSFVTINLHTNYKDSNKTFCIQIVIYSYLLQNTLFSISEVLQFLFLWFTRYILIPLTICQFKFPSKFDSKLLNTIYIMGYWIQTLNSRIHFSIDYFIQQCLK